MMSLLFIIFALSLNGYQNTPKRHDTTPMNIKISWELIGNMIDGEPKCRTRFIIDNNSKVTLNSSNWDLFFSQLPRPPLKVESARAYIEHINGDWFKLTPAETFLLKPGQKETIECEFKGYMIKETDAPVGPYFVIYDEHGNEKTIFPVEDYSIKPFTRAGQINRVPSDQTPIPSPANRYEANRHLSLLPPDEIEKIVPTPVEIKASPGKLTVDNKMVIYYDDPLSGEADFLAQRLRDITSENFGIHMDANRESKGFHLGLETVSVNNVNKEAYELTVSPDGGVFINGSDPAGVFYGIQSFLALLPIDAFGSKKREIEVDAVTVKDAPRFHYRAQHLDVGRNFQSKETVLKLIDLMAFYKLNTLQLYLSEDEGWRVEIEKLPELTEIGSRRQHCAVESAALHPSYGSGPAAYTGGTYGSGFYSREDFIEILKYAHKRHVMVIPTINFPGHARAAIKSMEARYNRLMNEGREKDAEEFRLIDPDDESVYFSAQGYKDNVVCVARESVYHFYDTVVKSLANMYKEAGVPFEFFHSGGDEVPEGVWTESPLCRNLLDSHPEFKDPKNLHVYFFRKLVDILKKYDVKIGGWEEVALFKDEDDHYVPNREFVGKNVIPYIWNNLWGDEDLGYKMANAGYSVVLCNVSNFYFDFAYDKDPEEPGLYWAGFTKTRDPYVFAPFDMFKTTTETSMGRQVDIDKEYRTRERLKVENRKNIIGLQAQLWSETIKGGNMLEYFYLPKIIAFAESAWASERGWETIEDHTARTKAINKSWNVFANSLAQRELPRLDLVFGGSNYRIPLPGAVVEKRILKANVEFPGLKIRYTSDGSTPDGNSTLYTGPVEVTGTIKLRAFDSAGNASRTSIVATN
tara:strand:+ start:4045 stop:6633 length:2589 start_codon:yes stop_codon:yes gene_type:complete